MRFFIYIEKEIINHKPYVIRCIELYCSSYYGVSLLDVYVVKHIHIFCACAKAFVSLHV